MSPTNDYIASGIHPISALTKMKLLREKSALCDVTLKITDTEIPAHKVVLAASSPYFEFMFTGNVKERTKECIEIDGFSPDAFLTVVNFMYSGYLVMNEETMLGVLKVADFLKISSAKEACMKYLQQHINISNCTIIRDIAKKLFLTELEAKVKSFIENNFADFIKAEVFFQLSVNEVKDIITEHSSYIDDSLYEKAISDWVEYEKNSRENLKEDLLGFFNVHTQNLSQKELNVYNSFLTKRIYAMSREASLSKVSFIDLKNFTWNCACYRPKFDIIPPIFHNQSVYVIGNDHCARLNTELEEWETKRMPYSNDYAAACSVRNGIYLITKGSSRRTFMYNTELNVLYPEYQLLRERFQPGVAFSDNCLYVCGGGNCTAERRDLRTNVWRSISHLPTLTDECSATSFHDKIYLASVSSGKFFEFDKRKGVWIPKAEIPKVENGAFSIGSNDEAIYSYNGKEFSTYETDNDTWKCLNMTTSSSSFVCTYPG